MSIVPHDDDAPARGLSLEPTRRRRSRRVAWSVSTGLFLSTTISMAAAAAPAEAPDLQFGKAYIGMTREAWLALPKSGPRDEALCTDAPAASAAGLNPTTDERAAGLVICTRVRRYGGFVLPQTVILPAGRRATHVRYGFAAGRLARIDYHLPVDAYVAQVARFKVLYGAADMVVRDRVRTSRGALPRVTQRWVTPEGAIELIDPVAPFGELSVGLAATGRDGRRRAVS